MIKYNGHVFRVPDIFFGEFARFYKNNTLGGTSSLDYCPLSDVIPRLLAGPGLLDPPSEGPQPARQNPENPKRYELNVR